MFIPIPIKAKYFVIGYAVIELFLGVNQLIVLDNQPVAGIINIAGFILDTDYEFVKDDTGVSNSVRAQDGVRFLPGGSSPSVGDTINIEYLQDTLISDIQTFLGDADNDVGGQDPLVRSGAQVDITMTAQLVILPGFSFSTIQSTVTDTIVNFINNLGLGDDAQKSDIQAEVRGISGVDNFIFSVIDRVGSTGNVDVEIEKNEFARITSGDITITV